MTSQLGRYLWAETSVHARIESPQIFKLICATELQILEVIAVVAWRHINAGSTQSTSRRPGGSANGSNEQLPPPGKFIQCLHLRVGSRLLCAGPALFVLEVDLNIRAIRAVG